jgi:hypothetical protein
VEGLAQSFKERHFVAPVQACQVDSVPA